MFSIPPEYFVVVNTVFLSILTAAGAAVVKWLMWKSAHWERMTEEVRIRAEEAKEYSQGNRKLLERTLERTGRLEQQTNGLSARLRTVAAENAFQAGKSLGEMKTAGTPQDELEYLEKEFHERMDAAVKSSCEPDPNP